MNNEILFLNFVLEIEWGITFLFIDFSPIIIGVEFINSKFSSINNLNVDSQKFSFQTVKFLFTSIVLLRQSLESYKRPYINKNSQSDQIPIHTTQKSKPVNYVHTTVSLTAPSQ